MGAMRLTIVALLSSLFGLYGTACRAAEPSSTKKTREQCLAAIKKLGAKVEPYGNGVGVVMRGIKLKDADLVHLKGIPDITFLDISANKAITDKGLACVSGLKDLETLYLGNTSVTDTGLKHLEQLNKLDELSLLYTKVSDKGAKEFEKKHPKIRVSY